MKHMLLGYAVPKGLEQMTGEDARKLTHVNVAFGVIRDGLLDMSKLDCLKDEMKRIRPMNPGLKFVLSVGGWGAGGFSDMSLREKGRRDFAESVGRALDEYGLDGVDIDWEYPCSRDAGIDADPRDKENFTLLLQQLRRVAGERIVSIAAGGGAYFTRDTEMDRVAAVCDYVQIMTYDLRGGFTAQAGHHTGLYPAAGDESGRSTADCVELFRKAGVPYDKIVIGAAFYARRWDNVPDVNHGLMQQAGSVGQYGAGYGQLTREFIGKNGFVRYWDDRAQAPYLFNGSTFISYDDPQSIACKCAYLREKGLRGIMYWEHASDDTHTLLDAMYRALQP